MTIEPAWTMEMDDAGVVRIRLGPYEAAKLDGGMAVEVLTSWHHMRQLDEEGLSTRADDYASGVVAGLIHCTMIGAAGAYVATPPGGGPPHMDTGAKPAR